MKRGNKVTIKDKAKKAVYITLATLVGAMPLQAKEIPVSAQQQILYENLQKNPNINLLSFKPTDFVRKHSWVKDEILSFLSQEEVKKELRFDLLNYNNTLNLSVQEGSILIGYGTAYNDGTAWINDYLFSNKDPEVDLIRDGVNKEKYQRDLDKLRELREDKEMLKLYRGLLSTHEIAHIVEFYSAREGSPITLTGHGVNDRIEVKILNNLYNSGEIDNNMYNKVIDFLEKYSNQ